jgi:hypothetical protein
MAMLAVSVKGEKIASTKTFSGLNVLWNAQVSAGKKVYDEQPSICALPGVTDPSQSRRALSWRNYSALSSLRCPKCRSSFAANCP